MGAQISLVSTSAATVSIEAYVAELNDILYEKKLGNSRFLKTIQGSRIDSNESVIVKVFIKPSPRVDLSSYGKQLENQRRLLADVPNAAPYQRLLETERAGYLVRQNFKTNLYDRISTRPFLDLTEKKWIAFQLLKGLEQCHARGVYHGDIKSENTLVTSWNWALLSDFAPFKPVSLPSDDPSFFSFFFDTSLRRTCYLAPERFADVNSSNPQSAPQEMELTGAHDIFSLGCVIAELFCEGTPIFSLSQLYKYRQGEYEPQLDGIEDEGTRELVRSMISLKPENRLTASEYLEQFKGSAFPVEFYDFVYDFISSLTYMKGPTACDDRIESIYLNFKMTPEWGVPKKSDLMLALPPTEGSVTINLPGVKDWVIRDLQQEADELPLIYLTVIFTALKHTTSSISRIKACDLILMFSQFVNDEVRLDRSLPYLVSLLNDSVAVVQVAAIRSVAHLMKMVQAITPLNKTVFTEYLVPRLLPLINSNEVIVREALALYLPLFAKTAGRLANMTTTLNGSKTQNVNTEREELVESFEDCAVGLITDTEPVVKVALLKNILDLAVFFGKRRTNDVLLSHLITYLNDRNYALRLAFFDAMLELAPFIGAVSLERYILPLMIQTLADSEEAVVHRIMSVLCVFAELGLIRKAVIWETTGIALKLTLSPNNWIRLAAFKFVHVCSLWLNTAEKFCLLFPAVRPYLANDVTDFDLETLYFNSKKPLSRAVFSLAITWAGKKSPNSLFWDKDSKPTPNESLAQSLVLSQLPGQMSNFAVSTVKMDASNMTFDSIPRSPEDDMWIGKLQNIGFDIADLWKLATMRPYILQLAGQISQIREENDAGALDLEGVPLNNVFLKEGVAFPDETKPASFSSYDGDDVYVQQMLHQAYLEASESIRENPEGAIETQTMNSKRWKPTGTLVAISNEHTAQINRIVVSHNQQVFATGSDDGTVKIWESDKLEKNVIFKSCLTIDLQSKVKALAFATTNVLVAATESSKLVLIKLVFEKERCKRYEIMYTHKLPGGHCTWLELHRQTMVMCTTRGRVEALDIRGIEEGSVSLTLLYSLENPPQFGVPTTFAVDKRGNWLVVGTSRGILTLWDLRFQLLVKSWGIPGRKAIHRICLQPRGRGKRIFVSGGSSGGLVSVWDIERGSCSEVYQPYNSTVDTMNFEPIKVDNEEFQSFYGEAVADEGILEEEIQDGEDSKSLISTSLTLTDDGKYAYFVYSTSDRIVRLCDISSPENSCIVSGLDEEGCRVQYSRFQSHPKMVTISEKLVSPVVNKKRVGKPSRFSIISAEQQRSFKNHQDLITDTAILLRPYEMILSVDRSGYLRVFS
ncbi:putative serine/threonine-protein kinase VPS15 [Yarrowia sp. C11]|nr:putative serine/threonine-protein kinase VPS15 [Yarrowia sp. C11]